METSGDVSLLGASSTDMISQSLMSPTRSHLSANVNEASPDQTKQCVAAASKVVIKYLTRYYTDSRFVSKVVSSSWGRDRGLSLTVLLFVHIFEDLEEKKYIKRTGYKVNQCRACKNKPAEKINANNN